MSRSAHAFWGSQGLRCIGNDHCILPLFSILPVCCLLIMVFATVSRMLCLCLYLNDVLLLLQDHKMEMESEFERFGREGGDASNMSVAVTRAFGDVDERFGNYVYVPALVLSMQLFFHSYVRLHLSLMFAL